MRIELHKRRVTGCTYRVTELSQAPHHPARPGAYARVAPGARVSTAVWISSSVRTKLIKLSQKLDERNCGPIMLTRQALVAHICGHTMTSHA